ncbi:hypothetical protein CYLTODRAFT_385801 [Cylindrobasidium torrendii FP15055 ss-10]|uniref:Carbohydrate-binding module family 19 domain-containing protein n=1 Tax=Cylindrobasidium torrendii FP15055 ss-10 TaxID=1314674 RepID=A0A0D7BU98_9AGAR|nr:hypothetical protein CYLTODRAFT_385801 [Cylindrobasidium torrendii FP15055 ss-10]
MLYLFYFAIATLFAAVRARPFNINDTLLLENAELAQQRNVQFASLSADDSCEGDENACISGSTAQCNNGKWSLTQCDSGSSCFAIPKTQKSGVRLICDTNEHALSIFEASKATGGIFGNSTEGADSASTDSDHTIVSAATSSSATMTSASPDCSTSAETQQHSDVLTVTVTVDPASSSTSQEAVLTVTVTVEPTSAPSASASVTTITPPATIGGSNSTPSSSSAEASASGAPSTISTFATTETISPSEASAVVSSAEASASTTLENTAVASSTKSVIDLNTTRPTPTA